MQNQKNPNNLNHEFIRKSKRKHSPKQKNQNIYQFKCAHNKNNNLKAKEENISIQYQQRQTKNSSDIVLDLKHQLTFLKDQMAKIVNSKVQTAINQNDSNKLKVLDYYFPSKTQENQKQTPKQIKKIKSKDRLKLSKLKKPQKFSPLSPSKKSQQTNSPDQVKQQQASKLIPKEEITKNRTKSIDQRSTLEEQVKKIGQKHKKQLDLKLNSLLQQQNIDNNSNQTVSDETELKTYLAKQLSSNRLSNVNIQIKINRLKKTVKEQQIEIQNFKRVIRQKSDFIIKLEIQFEKYKEQSDKFKHNFQNKEVQNLSLSKKISEIIFTKNQIEHKYLELNQQAKKSKQMNAKLHEDLNSAEHKLKNRELQIIKLQKQLKNTLNEIQDFKIQKTAIIQTLTKEISINQFDYQEQMIKMTKIIEDLKQKQKLRSEKQKNLKKKDLQQIQSNNFNPNDSNCIGKFGKQQNTLNIPPNPSPRGSPSTTLRQRQLLNVIKIHQKSIQNYQKDIGFLQIECKNLHFFKQLSKKQEVLIRETNEQIMTEEIMSLNAKLLKRKGSSNLSPRVTNRQAL